MNRQHCCRSQRRNTSQWVLSVFVYAVLMTTLRYWYVQTGPDSPNEVNLSRRQKLPPRRNHRNAASYKNDYKLDHYDNAPTNEIAVCIVYSCSQERFDRFVSNVDFSEMSVGVISFYVVEFLCSTPTVFPVRIAGSQVNVKRVNRRWSRSANANALVRMAQHTSKLVLVDIDMKVSDELLFHVEKYVAPDVIYFPIVWSLFSPESHLLSSQVRPVVPFSIDEGFWRIYGYGMVALHNKNYDLKWDESFTQWGLEDNDFFNRVQQDSSLNYIREQDSGLVHMYHSKDCSSLHGVHLAACLKAKEAYTYSDVAKLFIGKKPVLLVLCNRDSVETYVRVRGISWLKTTQALFHLVFVVGCPVRERCKAFDVLTVFTTANVLIYVSKAPRFEYPPTQKLINALKYEWPFSFTMMVVTDFDTYVNPERTVTAMASYDSSDIIYLGRRLFHCRCNQTQDPDVCTLNNGIAYVGGSMVILSRALLITMRPKWQFCVDTCKVSSSDTFLGYCLSLNAIQPNTWEKGSHSGKSWGEHVLTGNNVWEKKVYDSPVCQISGVPGGLGLNGVVASPHLAFNLHDFSSCLSYHPLKRHNDVRYVQIAESFHQPRKLEYDNYEDQCLVSIGVLTTRKHTKNQQLILETWGKMALAFPNVRFHFIVAGGTGPKKSIFYSVPHLKETYTGLFSKVVSWMSWVVESSDCQYLFKFDDDHYLRVMVLLQQLSKLSSGSEHYFGIHRWDNSLVVSDLSSPWAMSNVLNRTTYPPYFSGAGYGLSRNLAAYITRRSMGKHYNVEDAMIGVMVEEFASIRFTPSVTYTQIAPPVVAERVQCIEEVSVHDSAHVNKNFDMRLAFEFDLNRSFCAYATDRKLRYGHQ